MSEDVRYWVSVSVGGVDSADNLVTPERLAEAVEAMTKAPMCGTHDELLMACATCNEYALLAALAVLSGRGNQT